LNEYKNVSDLKLEDLPQTKEQLKEMLQKVDILQNQL
jgi:hypothetical protein